MTVFILGGAGFVGSAFARLCRRDGIDHYIVELENYDEFRGKECDLLINAAGNSKKYLAAENPPEDFRYSLLALLETFFDFRFRSYVYISSIDVYPDHTDPTCNREDAEIEIENLSHYGFHKYLGECMVRHYLSRWLIVRLGGVLGPGLKKNPVFDLLHDIPLRVSEESSYQYIATDTVAALVLELARLERWNEVFNLCGTGTVEIREIRKWLGKPLRYHGDSSPSPEHYEVNNDKLKDLFDVPDSRRTARSFIENFKPDD